MRWILNSLIIVTFACLGQMFASVMVAYVDGLGYFGVWARIVLPLMKPVLLALGVQFPAGTSTNAQTPPHNLVMVGALFLTLPMVLRRNPMN